MKKLTQRLLSLGVATLTLLGASGTAYANSNPAFHKAMATLTKTAAAGDDAGASFSVTKVKGKTAENMLKNYARGKGYQMADLEIVSQMNEAQIPEVDGGVDIMGFARYVDVVGLAVDLYGDLRNSNTTAAMSTYSTLRSEALKALFVISKIEGLKFGVESAGWKSCGSIFPSLLVLDVANQTLYSLAPNDTGC